MLAAMLRTGAVLATTGAPGTIVVTAAFGADQTVMRFAADQTVAAVELVRSVAAGRAHLQQSAFSSSGDAAFFSVDAGVLAADETAGLARYAATLVTEMAGVAIRIATTFGADQLLTNATGRLSQWAGQHLRHTGAGFAGFATRAV